MTLPRKAGSLRLLSTALIAATVALPMLAPAHLRAQSGEIAAAVRQAQSSVVSIHTFAAAGDTGSMSVGSGFLFDKHYIVTGRSVAGRTDSVEIELSDGRISRGRLVEFEQSSEIAVLEHGLDAVAPIKMGRSADAAAGMQVAILGNSLGIFPSVTLGRYIRKRSDGMMEIDGTVPPGNCGSPVLDSRGSLIGMIVGRLQDTGNPSRVISLAVSAEKIGSMLNRFKRDIARSGWIGISVVDLEPGAIPDAGHAAVKPPSKRHPAVKSEAGVRVVGVVAKGPADKAGIAVGDTIVRIRGNAVSTARQAADWMKTVPPNSRVAFSIRKGNRETEKTVIVAGRPRLQP